MMVFKEEYHSPFLWLGFAPQTHNLFYGACADVRKGSARPSVPGKALRHICVHAGDFPKVRNVYKSHMYGKLRVCTCAIGLCLDSKPGGTSVHAQNAGWVGGGALMSFLPGQKNK